MRCFCICRTGGLADLGKVMIITDVEYAFDDSEIFNLQFYEYAVPFFLNKIVVTLKLANLFRPRKKALLTWTDIRMLQDHLKTGI